MRSDRLNPIHLLGMIFLMAVTTFAQDFEVSLLEFSGNKAFSWDELEEMKNG